MELPQARGKFDGSPPALLMCDNEILPKGWRGATRRLP